MNITKELLTKYDLISTVFVKEGLSSLCLLRRTENSHWTFSVARGRSYIPGEILFLQFNFKSSLSGEADVKVLESGSDFVTVYFDIQNCNETAKDFSDKISLLETVDEKFGRRKEERIKIGKSSYSKFGLSIPEQKVFLTGSSEFFPCAVLDVSIHGVCLIAPYEGFLKKADIISVQLNFANPNATVVLRVHTVHSFITETKNKNFVRLSCQILEPISFEWKKRVSAMIEETQETQFYT